MVSVNLSSVVVGGTTGLIADQLLGTNRGYHA